jgi:hypothetical protein
VSSPGPGATAGGCHTSRYRIQVILDEVERERLCTREEAVRIGGED